MTTAPDMLYHMGGVPVGGLETFGIGNVYFACDSGATIYPSELIQSKMGMYADGTARLHATVQAALDACTTNRNDYVVILSNYDLTAALTMTKNRVHLLSPAGFKPGSGYPGDYALYQTGTGDVLTVTGNRCEIAGFVLIGAQGYDVIDIGTTWDSHIHSNYFAMAATASSDNYGITGSAVIQANIHDNLFTNHLPGAMSGDDNDIAAYIAFTSGSSTRGSIRNNRFSTGNNTLVASALSIAGSDMIIEGNVLWETAAIGAAEAGAFTAGITYSGGNGLMANNRIGITDTSKAIVGGTAINCVNNYSSLSGGTIAT